MSGAEGRRAAARALALVRADESLDLGEDPDAAGIRFSGEWVFCAYSDLGTHWISGTASVTGPTSRCSPSAPRERRSPTSSWLSRCSTTAIETLRPTPVRDGARRVAPSRSRSSACRAVRPSHFASTPADRIGSHGDGCQTRASCHGAITNVGETDEVVEVSAQSSVRWCIPESPTRTLTNPPGVSAALGLSVVPLPAVPPGSTWSIVIVVRSVSGAEVVVREPTCSAVVEPGRYGGVPDPETSGSAECGASAVHMERHVRAPRSADRLPRRGLRRGPVLLRPRVGRRLRPDRADRLRQHLTEVAT